MRGFRKDLFNRAAVTRRRRGDFVKENIKAALLSGLVLPGLGQILRGRRVKGGILLLLVTVLLIAAMLVLASLFQDLLHASRLAGGMDGAVLAERLRARAPSALWMGIAFLCLWCYAVADALLDSGKGEGAETDVGQTEHRGGKR